MKVRSHLSFLAIGMAALLIVVQPLLCSAYDYDVIIVGAGVAGLTAAAGLGIGPTTLVLEARNRTCGRIWTDSSSTVVADLGAQYISLSDSLQYSSDWSMPSTTVDFNSYLTFDTSTNATIATQLIPSTGTPMKNATSFYNAFMDYLNDYSSPYSTLQAAYTAYLSHTVQTSLVQSIIDNLFTSDVIDEYGADLSQINPNFFSPLEAKYSTAPSMRKILTNGMKDICSALQGIVNPTLQLGFVVNSVSHGSGYASVTGINSAGVSTTYTARRVIVTVPIGVLKAGKITFQPTLDQSHLSAIQNIGSALLNRVILVFSNAASAATLSALMTDTTNLPGFVYGTIHFMELLNRGNASLFWQDVGIRLPSAAGSDWSMVLTAGGSTASLVETMTDSAVIATALTQLRRLAPLTALPSPSAAFVTRWGSDPYSLGSASFGAPTTTFYSDAWSLTSDFDALAAPAASGILFFAGEATDSQAYATLLGASNSGQTAATLVLASLSNDAYGIFCTINAFLGAIIGAGLIAMFFRGAQETNVDPMHDVYYEPAYSQYYTRAYTPYVIVHTGRYAGGYGYGYAHRGGFGHTGGIYSGSS